MEGRWYVDPLTRVLLRAHTTAASKASPRPRIPASLRNTVFQSCHQTLIHLGDLSRYRETELVDKDKERNWGPAKGYYDLAAEIYPDSGGAHNQLAVISREDGDHFRSVYTSTARLRASCPIRRPSQTWSSSSSASLLLGTRAS